MSGDIFVVPVGGRRSGAADIIGWRWREAVLPPPTPRKAPLLSQQGIVQPRMLLRPRLRKTENRDCNFMCLYILPIADNTSIHASILHVHIKMFNVDEFDVVGKKISKFWSFISFILCVYNASPYLVLHSISRSSRATDDDIENKNEDPNKNKYLLHDRNCSKPSWLFFFFIKCVPSGILLSKICMMLIALFVCSNFQWVTLQFYHWLGWLT